MQPKNNSADNSGQPIFNVCSVPQCALPCASQCGIYVYMYTYISVYVSTCIYKLISTYVFTHTQTYTHIRTHIHTNNPTHTLTHTHVYTSVYSYQVGPHDTLQHTATRCNILQHTVLQQPDNSSNQLKLGQLN